MKTFREFVDEKRRMNEMPQYIDHDYIPFKPVENRSMQVIEARFDKIKLEVPSSRTRIDKDTVIYINKRRTMVFMGLTVWDNERGSWELEVVTWLKLEKSRNSNNLKVIGVHTKEDEMGRGYTLTLYYSLIKAGYLLESDNEQYQGAKPLWKALSRLVQVEVYDEDINKVIVDIYDEHKVEDSEIWSEDGKHFLKTLRVKK